MHAGHTLILSYFGESLYSVDNLSGSLLLECLGFSQAIHIFFSSDSLIFLKRKICVSLESDIVLFCRPLFFSLRGSGNVLRFRAVMVLGLFVPSRPLRHAQVPSRLLSVGAEEVIPGWVESTPLAGGKPLKIGFLSGEIVVFVSSLSGSRPMWRWKKFLVLSSNPIEWRERRKGKTLLPSMSSANRFL